jgi:transforming growth factor-beta-induced protein
LKKTLASIATAVGLVALVAPSTASAAIPEPLPPQSIAEVATTAGFSTLVDAVTAAGLAPTLADCTAGPFTVFAPTNEAFAALDPELLADALADPSGLLTDILTYHVVPGILNASAVTSSSSLTTLQGGDIAVNGTVLNGSVNITDPNAFACNGVVHEVDAVLIPSSIASVATDGGFTTLVAALNAAALVPTFADCSAGPFTVFAPTDAAFEALDDDLLAAALADPSGLLTDILNYHVVPGILGAGEVTAATSLTTAQGSDIAVNGTVLNGSANITSTNNWACNGVVHAIDAVLIPSLPSIATIATDGGFTTLVAALDAAGLVPTFADCSAGPFTVFAPTDAAFAAALTALGLTAEQLLANTQLLTTVLQYHVVPGLVGAAEVTSSTSLVTLQGESISVSGAVLNGSADITAPNNWACNGVVHVIDAVLLPPSLTATPTTTTTTTVAPTTTAAPVTELPATGNDATVALFAGLFLIGGAGLLIARRRPTA